MKKPANVDEYIQSQPESDRKVLEEIRKIILDIVPEATELISYSMPAFKYHGLLLWYANAKDHYGIYPYSKTIEHFADRLHSYSVSKGTIRLPHGKPLPKKLIGDIVKYRVKENLEREKQKKSSKKSSKKSTL